MAPRDAEEGGSVPTDEERARALRDQLKSVHAFDLAYEMAISLVSFGYQKMGLTDETRELRDLDDARLAIELLRADVGVLERERGEGEVRDLRSTLAQMQLSYARAVQAAGPAGKPEGPAAEQPAAKEPVAEQPAAEKPAEEKTAAPKKPAAKRTTPKKLAAKKTAPKRPAAKKTATKKPAAKKPPAKKPRGTPTPPAG
jgi:hypothetical protein